MGFVAELENAPGCGPGEVNNLLSVQVRSIPPNASVVELVDTPDLESGALNV